MSLTNNEYKLASEILARMKAWCAEHEAPKERAILILNRVEQDFRELPEEKITI